MLAQAIAQLGALIKAAPDPATTVAGRAAAGSAAAGTAPTAGNNHTAAGQGQGQGQSMAVAGGLGYGFAPVLLGDEDAGARTKLEAFIAQLELLVQTCKPRVSAHRYWAW